MPRSRALKGNKGSSAPASAGGTATKSRKKVGGLGKLVVSAAAVAATFGGGEKPMSAASLRDALRGLSHNFGDPVRSTGDTHLTEAAERIAQNLHQLTEDGCELVDSPEPRLLECAEYNSSVQEGPAFSVRGSVPMALVDPWKEIDDRLDGTAEVPVEEEVEPVIEEPEEVRDQYTAMAEYYADYFDLDEREDPRYEVGETCSHVMLVEPGIRVPKQYTKVGGTRRWCLRKPKVTVEVALRSEFQRELFAGLAPFDARCENCKRELPHNTRGKEALIEALLNEGEVEQQPGLRGVA